MADRNFTDKDLEALSKMIGKAVGSNRAPTSVGAASVQTPVGDLNLFKLSGEAFTKAADLGLKAYEKVSKEIDSGMDTWRNFTKSGIAFGNDVVGMSVAAKGARVDLGEFAQTIKENQVNLAGFGGGVGAGAKAFADLSKKMFDAGESTDSLRQLGYTNKELNDVLALQAGMIGSSMRAGKEKDELAIKAATDLAYEMDTMAKLTGKSREAQMESQKKLAADAAFQAKLEQATRNMGEKEAAEYRSKIMAEYTKAEAIGLGQSFKETFTYGQVMSKAAANEQAIAGKAGVESARAAQAAAANNFEEASRRMSNAQDEAIKNNKNANFQQLVIYGQFSGAAGESAQKQFMANKAITDTVKALEKETDAKGNLINAGKGEAELKKLAIEKIKAEQDAAAGSTKAALNLQQRMNDLSSVVAESLVKPLNKDVNPALNRFADELVGARSALIKGGQEKGNVKALEDSLAEGRRKALTGDERTKGATELVGYGATKLGTGLNKVGETGIDAAKAAAAKIQRQGGSLEMGGKLFENWGPGTLVELHGLEGVVRPEDMKKILSSSMGGIGEALGKQQVKSQDMSAKEAAELLQRKNQEMAAKFSAQKMPGGDITSSISDVVKQQLTAGMVYSKEAASAAQKMPEIKLPEIKLPEMPSMISGGGFGGAFSGSMPGLDISTISKNLNTTISSTLGTASKDIKMPTQDLASLTTPFSEGFSGLVSKFKNVFQIKSKKLAEPTTFVDEFGDLEGAMARASQNIDTEFGDLEGAMAKVAQDTQDEFGDLAGAMKRASEQMYPDTEFGDLVGAIDKVSQDIDTEFGDLEGAMARVSQSIDTEFGDLEGAMARVSQSIDTEFGDLEGAMAKVAGDIHDEFGDLAGAMSNAAEEMYPDTEFGNLESAIARVNQDIDTEFGDLSGAMAKVAQDSQDEFGDLEGAMKQAQEAPYDEFAGLDQAIARQQQMNMPYDEMAGVDEAVAKNSMQDLISTTSPTTAQASRGPIDINSFTLGPNGLPIPKPKSTKAAVPDKPTEKTASPGKAINPETGEEYTPVGAATTGGSAASGSTGTSSTAKPAGGEGGKSTLDDVVKALSTLNSKVGQLIQTSEQGYATIARSAKAGSNNLYERAKA